MKSGFIRAMKIVVLVFLAASAALAQTSGSNQNEFVIHNVRIFDGSRVIQKGDVWVQNGLIKAEGVKVNAVMVYSQRNGYIPARQSFAAGPEWKKVTMPFSAFGTDGHDLMGIFFGAASVPGHFTFMIDNVRLE